MNSLAKACVALAIVSFAMAVVTVFTGSILVGAEGWSRACTNLALVGLALFVGFKEPSAAAT